MAANGNHCRHHAGDRNNRVFRSSKHRYVTFIGNRKFRKLAKMALRYPVMGYPKADNLGEWKHVKHLLIDDEWFMK